MAQSFQPSKPSYLLADFPSTSQDRLRTYSKENPRTTELILEDAETPAARIFGPHNGFRWKFMPGRVFAQPGAVSSVPSVMEGTLEYPDIVMRYLDDPQRNGMHLSAVESDKDMFKSVTPNQFGRHLAQVISTYLLVSQVYQSAMQADDPFEQNITVPIQVSNLVEVYAVNWTWMSLFFASCAILLASGIVSAVFAHLAVGPEILGYASSAVRDSKYMDLPPELGTRDALEVTKIIGQKKVRYGFTEEVSQDGQPFVGIGLENKIKGIQKHRPFKSNLG